MIFHIVAQVKYAQSWTALFRAFSARKSSAPDIHFLRLFFFQRFAATEGGISQETHIWGQISPRQLRQCFWIDAYSLAFSRLINIGLLYKRFQSAIYVTGWLRPCNRVLWRGVRRIERDQPKASIGSSVSRNCARQRDDAVILEELRRGGGNDYDAANNRVERQARVAVWRSTATMWVLAKLFS